MGNLLVFLKANFFHVAPILAAGIFAIAILLERIPALLWIYPMGRQAEFFARLRDLVMGDRIAEAVALCEASRSKLSAQIAKEGLLRAHQPEALIEDELEIAVRSAGQRVLRRTQFLSTIANVSTLLGLFGTIVGLIQSFDAVGSASAQERANLLAAGISTSMNSTMLGLAVAIPCMVAFSYLMNHTNRLIEETEQAAIRTMALIRQRAYSSELEVSDARRSKAA
jgi:biopolymer transport protein ExbB/TolQ